MGTLRQNSGPMTNPYKILIATKSTFRSVIDIKIRAHALTPLREELCSSRSAVILLLILPIDLTTDPIDVESGWDFGARIVLSGTM